MSLPYPSDALLRDVLARVKRIAVVGASANPARPSYNVSQFLSARGYQIIAVNPGLAGQMLHGWPVYANLADIPEPVDMVDIFRRVAAVPGVVDDALAAFPALDVIWMQLEILHAAAAEKARARGVTVVENRCPKIEILRLF